MKIFGYDNNDEKSDKIIELSQATLNCKKSDIDKIIKFLTEVKKEIETYHVNCHAFVGDMGRPEDVSAFFTQIKEEFHHLDILINNAGISYFGLLQEMTDRDWDRILSTNLSSVFYCSRLAIQMMLPKKSGKILSISSVWGCTGASTEVAYSATKGGVNAFTKALAKELAPYEHPGLRAVLHKALYPHSAGDPLLHAGGHGGHRHALHRG